MSSWSTIGPNQRPLGFVFEHSGTPMVVVRSDNRVIDVNAAFTAAFGHQREELVGRAATVFVSPAWQRRVEAEWNTLRRAGSVFGDRTVICSDQRQAEVQFAATRLRVDGYEAALFVAIEWHRRPLELRKGSANVGAELTPKELEVVSKIALGMRVHEIAALLERSATTVQTHVRNAMAKFGARSQAQLIALAMATGQLDPAALGPDYDRDRAPTDVGGNAGSTSG